jgi:hypothetical protein
MVDKRFWSGAILTVTIVVAGASSLPALLLRPPAPAVPAAVTRTAEPVATRVEPQPVAKAEPLPAPQIAVVQPPAKPIAPPQPASAPAPEPPPAPLRAATPVAFPPVQPVGVATPGAPATRPAATSPTDSAAVATPALETRKAAGAERAVQQVPKRKRNVTRPAPYPIREFLAWRR